VDRYARRLTGWSSAAITPGSKANLPFWRKCWRSLFHGAMLLQLRNAIKPLLVFAATPQGVAGALLCLTIMGSPFAFMAIASLIGVIVSHVIVLFDFIEEMHEKGEPFG